MSNYQLAHLGNIDPENPEEYYETEIQWSGRSLGLDLTIECGRIEIAALDAITKFLSDLDGINETALKSIRENYAAGSTVKEYITHHLDELPEDEVQELLQDADQSLSPEEQMLSLLHLKRAGFNPDNEDIFITLDYTIGEDLTDYLIVVDLTREGEVDYITMES